MGRLHGGWLEKICWNLPVLTNERLLARLGVTEIMKDSKIEVEDKDVDAKIKEMSASYPKEQQKQMLEHYKKGSDGYNSLKNNIAADKLIAMLTK